MQTEFDYIVVGSGFGGSVSALRLAEKGYSVLVIEKGRRYESLDFPKTNWNLRKYVWMPVLGFYGIQKVKYFRRAFILRGAVVGVGGLVYENTLMKRSIGVLCRAVWYSLCNCDICLVFW